MLPLSSSVVLEPNSNGTWQLIMCGFFQFQVRWRRVGTLKITMMRTFTETSKCRKSEPFPHSRLLNIYPHTACIYATIFPFTEFPFLLFTQCHSSWFSTHFSFSIFSFAGSSSIPWLHVSIPWELVLDTVFFLSYVSFKKNNLTNFHVFKYYHYADQFQIRICSPDLPPNVRTQTSSYLCKLNSSNSWSKWSFRLNSTNLSLACLLHPNTLHFSKRSHHLLEDSDIIHSSSPSILMSNPAANPVNSTSKISFSSCFYPSLLLSITSRAAIISAQCL